MAVLKNKRKEGQLKVITLGDELTVSSFGMLKSMNKFYTEVFGILPKLKGTK